MPRKKTAASAEVTPDPVPTEAARPDVFDEAIANQQTAAAIVQEVADNTRLPEQPSFAEKVGKRQYTPEPNPHSIEGVTGTGNRVHLLKEQPNRATGFPGAWVIRFDKSPNEMEGYSKENPHPVLKMLKDEGFRWGFSGADNEGGHGKVWQERHYTYAEHMDARRVLARAAEMIGAKVEQGAGVA